MLKGDGAKKSMPKLIGRFIGINELNLRGQGMNSWVSGCIAVEHTFCALRIFSISSGSTSTSGDPVLSYWASSLAFCCLRRACISLISEFVIVRLKGLAVARKD